LSNKNDAELKSFSSIRALFEMLDNSYEGKIREVKEWRNNAEARHAQYIGDALKSMDEMGLDYDYHNYDYGEEQELLYEIQGADNELVFFNEIKESQLMALCEIKILYLYKEVETRLKTIIYKYYGASTRKLSNLSKISDFFDRNSIDIKKIQFYEKVDDLRCVSNDLKHSLKINQSKHISEFNGLETFSGDSLESFLNNKLSNVDWFFYELLRKVEV